MMSKVLVTYASKYGATEEIAQRIAEVLAGSGLQTDVLPVQAVSHLNPYEAVVLGSALYVGRWRKAARKFLKRYEQKLAAKDVWVFLSGPTGEGETEDGAWHQSKKLEARLERIKPHDVKVFHGKLDPDSLSGLESWVIERVGAPTGDFRDWTEIEAWARDVGEAVKRRQA